MGNFMNKFYNQTMFNLIKVAFSNDTNQSYTYAVHIGLNVKKDDYVVVPTGAEEDVFSLDNAHETTRVVKVIAITADMSNIPTEYELKHVIQKVKGKAYNQILKAKKAFKQ